MSRRGLHVGDGHLDPLRKPGRGAICLFLENEYTYCSEQHRNYHRPHDRQCLAER
jgi:hypothetical protein